MATPLEVNESYIKVPQVTTTEREALTPANGMVVYDTTANAFYKYEGGAWSTFAGGSGAAWGSISGTLSAQIDLQNALNAKASTTSLTSHTSNTSNPHSVTATQVGLGNVNNTSDANKPISIATQTALDAKQNKHIIAVSTVISTHTGTTSETKVASVKITGGTYAAGNVIRIIDRDRKTGTAGTLTKRIRIGTADDLSGTVIFQVTPGATVINDSCTKTGVIRHISTDTEFGSTGTRDDDAVTSIGAAFVSYSINWANDVWIVFSVQNSNSGDTSGNYYYEITKS